jgi:hypothetical protein
MLYFASEDCQWWDKICVDDNRRGYPQENEEEEGWYDYDYDNNGDED